MIQQSPTIIPGPNFIAFSEASKHSVFERADAVPLIIKKQNIFLAQRREILQKYRAYVQEYNQGILKQNRAILDHNSNVMSYVAQFNLYKKQEDVTAKLNNRIGRVSINEFNQAAKLANKVMGQSLIEMKKHSKIRKALEHTFSNIIFSYALQMDKKNSVLENVGAPTTRALQKVEVNPHALTLMTVDGVTALDYHPKTVSNHVKRFADAGILSGYEYRGQNKPVKYYVNNRILVVFDQISRKKIIAENQHFTSPSWKSLSHNKRDTKDYLNKKKITENVENHSHDKGENGKHFPLMQSLQDMYKNPQAALASQSSTLNAPGAAQNTHNNASGGSGFIKKQSALSDSLYSEIMDISEFMEDLTGGKFNNFRFRIRKQLEAEAYRGDLDRNEFRELLLQIFLKIAAPIWKNHTPFMASWRKAWNLINETMLTNPNGSCPNKSTLIYLFDNLVWRITWAKSYFRKHKDFNALFPSDYFDPTRKTQKSGGFAYTLEPFKNHQKYQENKEKQIAKRNAMAGKRNKTYKAIELVEKKVRALINGKCSIIELDDYVRTNANIPWAIKNKLPEYIQRASQA